MQPGTSTPGLDGGIRTSKDADSCMTTRVHDPQYTNTANLSRPSAKPWSHQIPPSSTRRRASHQSGSLTGCHLRDASIRKLRLSFSPLARGRFGAGLHFASFLEERSDLPGYPLEFVDLA